MKRYILISILYFIFPSMLFAQNLVPNPSFEDTIGCPNFISQIDRANYWSSFGQTPDYFNSCSIFSNNNKDIPVVGVPYNFAGVQYAATGNAYAGLETYDGYSVDYREYIGAQLISSLTIGAKYYLRMKVSLADSSNYDSNNIGVTFSNKLYSSNVTTELIKNNSIVNSNSIIEDTANWISISGSFIADSAYKYIIIGNFFDDIHTNIIKLKNSSSQLFSGAYYYIDDIILSTDSLQNIYNGVVAYKDNINGGEFYPNPSNDIIHFISNVQGYYECALTNLLGQTIKTYIIQPPFNINVKDIPDGIYIISLKLQNKIIQKKQIIIH